MIKINKIILYYLFLNYSLIFKYINLINFNLNYIINIIGDWAQSPLLTKFNIKYNITN